MLGKFNINALNNAVQNVNSAMQNARNKIEDLCKIENKTFANFVRPISDIEFEFSQVLSPIYHLDSVNNSDETVKIMGEILPVISDYYSDMGHHKPSYFGMKSVLENDFENMNDEQKLIVTDTIKSFEVGGINLDDKTQKRLKEIAARLTEISNDFSNNVINANKQNKIIITDEKLLGDMPQNDKESAKVDGGWEFKIAGPSCSKFLKFVTDRNLRKQMFDYNITRAPENEDIIPEILSLRSEQAKILGYKNYAELALEFRDASNPKQVEDYLQNLADISLPEKKQAYKNLCEYAGFELNAWDTGFYMQKYESEKLSVSDAEVKPYFELNSTLDKSLKLLGDMFNIEFVKRNADIWDKDVVYFDVTENNKIIAGIYFDLIARDSKQPGAWMNGFIDHHINSNGDEILPQCAVICSFDKPTDTAPTLLTLGQFETLMHELGHALHTMLSKTVELGSAEIDWDVVEFPSRFIEFLSHSKSVRKSIGEHYQTKEEIPDDLLNRLVNLDKFYYKWALSLVFDFFDMKLHTSDIKTKEQVQQIAEWAKENYSVLPKVDNDKFQNTFGHIFDGGYEAGYYSYMWSDSFAIDALAEYNNSQNKSEFLKKYRDTVLALSGSRSMRDIYFDFTGKHPDAKNIAIFYNLAK